MPLPPSQAEDFEWPPPSWKPVYDRYAEHAAWFSGDVSRLSAVYASGTVTGQFWRTTFDRFWARAVAAPQRRMMLHIPVAADIATVHSDILFSKPPDFQISDKVDGFKVIQDRLNEITDRAAIIRTLAEAAENQCALGGEFLRLTWDKELEPDYPILTAVDADLALPTFRWGRLTSVTFWSQLNVSTKDSKEVWRHLECHEPGYILSGLWMGDGQHLGIRVPLDSRPEFDLGNEEVVETGIEPLMTAVYVPNVKPNRMFRGSELGRSDYDGLEALMDALDETWTSWMRDLRLARARLIVPEEFVTGTEQGKPGYFDVDKEIWEALPMPVGKDREMITPSQFEIRTEDHDRTSKGLMARIIAGAGYSASTFDLEEGSAKTVGTTATEIINRERRSYVTRGRKVNYWTQPLEEILWALLAIDDKQGFASHGVARPSVIFSDTFRDDPQALGTVAQLLRQAQAASTETLVRMVQPKWDDGQVQAEVKKIDDQTAAAKPQPAPQPSPGPSNGAGAFPPGPQGARNAAPNTQRSSK
jgi:A118 family predicted phage portal protein